MTPGCTKEGKPKADMREFIANVKKEWRHQARNAKKPWSENLLEADKESKLLSEKESKLRHAFVVRNVFSHKRG